MATESYQNYKTTAIGNSNSKPDEMGINKGNSSRHPFFIVAGSLLALLVLITVACKSGVHDFKSSSYEMNVGTAALLTYAGTEGDVSFLPTPCQGNHKDHFNFYFHSPVQHKYDFNYDLKGTTLIGWDISKDQCLSRISFTHGLEFTADHKKSKAVVTTFKSMNQDISKANVMDASDANSYGEKFPDELNYWVSMNLNIPDHGTMGHGTINNFVIAQGSNAYLFGGGNNYWVGGPTCYYEKPTWVFCCKMTNGKSVSLYVDLENGNHMEVGEHICR